jgi:tetratricopeptide (TPR) repeat protein
MFRSRFLTLPLVLASGPLPVAAQAACPVAPDHAGALSALTAEAQSATTEDEARQISGRMWELWADAPDDQAQAILDRGMQRRAGYDFVGAHEDFDTLVRYCPDYAEGYNQRAFVNFLRQDFSAALVDLDKALDLSPDHVAALSGKALTLYALSRTAEAREVLARALSMNPWLPERGLAAPGGPLHPETPLPPASAAPPKPEGTDL